MGSTTDGGEPGAGEFWDDLAADLASPSFRAEFTQASEQVSAADDDRNAGARASEGAWVRDVPSIDLDADLNFEDDIGRNVARRPSGWDDLEPGSVLVAGRPGAWSWVVVDEVDGDWVTFRQLRASRADALRGPGRGDLPIVIDADLNMVDDDDRNFARWDPIEHAHLYEGVVTTAGRPGFWSWVVIDSIADQVVTFHQIRAHYRSQT